MKKNIIVGIVTAMICGVIALAGYGIGYLHGSDTAKQIDSGETITRLDCFNEYKRGFEDGRNDVVRFLIEKGKRGHSVRYIKDGKFCFEYTLSEVNFDYWSES